MSKPSTADVDHQAKAMVQHINQTEKYFADINACFSAVSRNQAKLRDKEDDLARALLTHPSPLDGTETSSELSQSLKSAANLVTHLADIDDDAVRASESRIISELSQYDLVCKAMREEVRINGSIRGKELLRRAGRSTRKGSFLRADKDFAKIVHDFEEQRNKDLKSVLLDFISIRLKASADSINLLTEAYARIQDVDIYADVERFEQQLLGVAEVPEAAAAEERNVKGELAAGEGKLEKIRSQSMGALNSMFSVNQFRRKSHAMKSQMDLNAGDTVVEADGDSKRRPTIVLTKDCEGDNETGDGDDNSEDEITSDDNSSDHSGGAENGVPNKHLLCIRKN